MFFNDPVPVADHETQATRMALVLQERFEQLAAVWRKLGTELGLGIEGERRGAGRHVD